VTRSEDAFVRYLTAKQTVDDRALHRTTFDRLVSELAARADARSPDPVRILEVGFGVGTMLDRLWAWDCLPERVEYVGVDIEPTNIESAADRLAEAGWTQHTNRQFQRTDGPRDVSVELHAGDAFEFATTARDQSTAEPVFDLVIGMAFLDVVDLTRATKALFPLLAGGGLGYFPITFDGETIFQPTDDVDREQRLMDAFHAAMDAPDRPGGSRTGSRLFAALPAAGAEVLAAGGSDWVVTPDPDGTGYPADEAAFLHHIIDTIETAIRTESPPEATHTLAEGAVREWAQMRRQQVDAGELVYAAHGFDHLIRVP